MVWAIKNKKTGKWLYGTDFRGSKKKQRCSKERAELWDTKELAESNIRWRGCGKNYQAVPVQIVEVKMKLKKKDALTIRWGTEEIETEVYEDKEVAANGRFKVLIEGDVYTISMKSVLAINGVAR